MYYAKKDYELIHLNAVYSQSRFGEPELRDIRVGKMEIGFDYKNGKEIHYARNWSDEMLSNISGHILGGKTGQDYD